MNATSTTPTRQSEATPFALPARSLEGVGKRPFGISNQARCGPPGCGNCDSNTTTAGELGTSASPQSWLEGLRRELDLAAEMTGAPAAETVFVGGGTPSLLGGDGLADVLSAVRSSFGLASGAEVTTESNPESTSPEFFGALRSAGFTRISLGMQSAAQHVLKILDRTHTPGRAVAAAKEARAAGFSHVNLDLIYGTPGERDQDLDASLDAVLSADVDHVSAYALIVEDGTAMARKVRRGELPAPDDDVLASRYERIVSRLSEAGLRWYEVSNWAKAETADSGDTRCRHNLGYWDGGDWWGAGPGAHSHVGGVRWWNVKHPARYAEQLALGELPVGGSEELTAEDEHMERVMLTARLRTGLPLSELSASERLSAEQVVVDGLAVIENDHVVLTDRGRLLADAVIRTILT